MTPVAKSGLRSAYCEKRKEKLLTFFPWAIVTASVIAGAIVVAIVAIGAIVVIVVVFVVIGGSIPLRVWLGAGDMLSDDHRGMDDRLLSQGNVVVSVLEVMP